MALPPTVGGEDRIAEDFAARTAESFAIPFPEQLFLASVQRAAESAVPRGAT